jgi:hypothetical protein
MVLVGIIYGHGTCIPITKEIDELLREGRNQLIY